ncbi:DNA polymerase III subunit psi [Candidatus Pantoea edessiphila]|uniref:DNA polymerase III subunit psi n=1 Tax=Candidatus Pantoea edessiphila TaxID=2044610 RepID=A0A2P5SW80_9GAMM|nr:DNA polymerase III subunit psi [Candidatus Pantoea edessiphila]PPI86570.1 hypothetical protein CRV10_01860 [Candidatus Pantoea edessiphila]
MVIENYSMLFKHNKILQTIGIVKYKLYRFSLLKGLSDFNFLSNIKLIIVTSEINNLNKLFIQDVMYSLHLKPIQVIIIEPKQLSLILNKLNCLYWFIGKEIKEPINGIVLRSESMTRLINSSDEKRSLWNQICKYGIYQLY